MATPPPWAMGIDGVPKGRWVARHLHRDVEALDHVQLGEHVGQGALARVNNEGRARPHGELATVGVRLADDDMAGAGMAGNGRPHQPDGPAPRPARPRREPSLRRHRRLAPGTPPHLERTAAYLLAVQRVADAMQMRGIYR